MFGFEIERLETMPRDDMDANELSYVASNFWLDPNQATLETSIDDLKRALELDPKHAASLAS